MTERLSMHACRDLLQVISWRVLQACLGALPGLPLVPVFGCSDFNKAATCPSWDV